MSATRVQRPLVPKPPILEIPEPQVIIQKQKKSRNGCLTCKSKRMKCDETKPACRHCTRRGIVCAGYPKSFKWKQFVDPEIGTRLQTEQPSVSGAVLAIDAGEEHHSNATGPSLSAFLEDAYVSIVGTSNSATTPTEVEDADDAPVEYEVVFSEAAALDGAMHAVAGAPTLDLFETPVWLAQLSPVASAAEDDQQISNMGVENTTSNTGLTPLYQQPTWSQFDLITLLWRSQTCGVLSIKHEWEENPWQSLILPLTRRYPALRHAINGLTCLQGCQLWPELHARGLSHVKQSVTDLRRSLADGAIRVDAALATTLVINMAKTWEAPRTATDYEFLNESRLLLKEAVAKVDFANLAPTHARRLRLLAHTWLYLDVLSRITAFNAEDKLDADLIAAFSLLGDSLQHSKIDPLLGCAADLFPLIGKAADLIRCVWRDEKKRNSPTVVAQAAELLRSAEYWAPQINLMSQEEPSCVVSDAMQTAEAYRWSMILMLRQAIPALPDLISCEHLAKKILVYLATVPASSGALVVHMFPLLIAGCEVTEQDDRNWVTERWRVMSTRLISGIVDRCLEMTAEAWRRKDGDITSQTLVPAAMSPMTFADDVLDLSDESPDLNPNIATQDESASQITSYGNNTDDVRTATKTGSTRTSTKREDSLRSRLSWLAIMHDWKWQVMLG